MTKTQEIAKLEAELAAVKTKLAEAEESYGRSNDYHTHDIHTLRETHRSEQRSLRRTADTHEALLEAISKYGIIHEPGPCSVVFTGSHVILPWPIPGMPKEWSG